MRFCVAELDQLDTKIRPVTRPQSARYAGQNTNSDDSVGQHRPAAPAVSNAAAGKAARATRQREAKAY